MSEQTHEVLSEGMQSQSEVIAGRAEQTSLRQLEALLSESNELFSGFRMTPPFAESAFSFDIPEVEQAKGSNRFTPSYRSYVIVWSTSLNQYFKGKEEPSQCSRRYKDFLWLRSQLVEQFPGIIVPPVPPKSLSSAMAKFTVIKDEEVVLYRQRALLKFLNRVAAIPVLAESSVFQRFLEYDSEEMMSERTGKLVVQDGPSQPGIKRSLGRRFREFTFSLSSGSSRAVATAASSEEGSDWLNSSAEYTEALSKCLESLKEKVAALSKRRRELSREVEKLGESFEELAAAEAHYNESELSKALEKVSRMFPELQDSLARQAEQEVLEVVETIEFYEKTLAAVHDQLSKIQHLRVTRHLLTTDLQEKSARVEELASAGKPSAKLEEDVSNLADRKETAEDLLKQIEGVFREDLERFHSTKQDDFRRLMASFVRLQLEYAQSVKHFWEHMVPCIDDLRSCSE